MRGPWIAGVVTAAFLLGAAGGAGGAGWWRGRADEPLPGPTGVAAVPPAPDGSAPSAAWPDGFVGVVLASEAADLAPLVEGRLAEVRAGLGDLVHAGDVLAVVSVAGADGRVAEARAALDVARAQRATAEIDLRAAERQVEQLPALSQAISEQEAADLRFAAERARAALARAEAEVEARGHQLEEVEATRSEAVLVAPFAGRVAARYRDPGALVGAGTPVVQLQAVTRRVRFAAPPEALPLLVPERPVSVELADAELALVARVDRVSPTMDPASGLVFVEATLDPGGDLVSGQPARVHLR